MVRLMAQGKRRIFIFNEKNILIVIFLFLVKKISIVIAQLCDVSIGSFPRNVSFLWRLYLWRVIPIAALLVAVEDCTKKNQT